MEKELKNWIENYRSIYDGKLPTSKDIKKQAMIFSKYKKEFKASKGWLEKFNIRHGYTEKKRKYFRDMNENILEHIETAEKIGIKDEYDYSHEYLNTRRPLPSDFEMYHY